MGIGFEHGERVGPTGIGKDLRELREEHDYQSLDLVLRARCLVGELGM
jgi:hypothetical protein